MFTFESLHSSWLFNCLCFCVRHLLDFRFRHIPFQLNSKAIRPNWAWKSQLGHTPFSINKTHIWIYLKLPAAICNYLELYAAICSYLQLSGAIWSCLELSGAIWSYLELSGVIWSCLELSGAVWSYVEHFLLIRHIYTKTAKHEKRYGLIEP